MNHSYPRQQNVQQNDGSWSNYNNMPTYQRPPPPPPPPRPRIPPPPPPTPEPYRNTMNGHYYTPPHHYNNQQAQPPPYSYQHTSSYHPPPPPPPPRPSQQVIPPPPPPRAIPPPPPPRPSGSTKAFEAQNKHRNIYTRNTPKSIMHNHRNKNRQLTFEEERKLQCKIKMRGSRLHKRLSDVRSLTAMAIAFADTSDSSTKPQPQSKEESSSKPLFTDTMSNSSNPTKANNISLPNAKRSKTKHAPSNEIYQVPTKMIQYDMPTNKITKTPTNVFNDNSMSGEVHHGYHSSSDDEDEDMWNEEKRSIIRADSNTKNIEIHTKKSKAHNRSYLGHSAWLTSIVKMTNDLQLEDNSETKEDENKDTKNNTFFLTSSGDHSIKLWDLNKDLCYKTFMGHSKIVWDVSVCEPSTKSPSSFKSSSMFLSASGDSIVKLWDMEKGTCLRNYKGHSAAVVSVESLPGKFLTGSNDCTIKLWDMETGYCFQSYDAEHSYAGITIEPVKKCSSDIFLSACWDQTIKLWDMKSGSCIRTFLGHSKSVEKVVSLDDKTFLSASDDHNIKLWDMGTGKMIHTFKGHTDCVTSIATLDEKFFVSVSGDGSAKLWNLLSGECLCSFFGHSGTFFISFHIFNLVMFSSLLLF